MFDRAEIIDKNFIDFVQSNNLPSLDSQLPLSDADLELSDLISLFESQVQSRHIDLKARAFKNEGKCFKCMTDVATQARSYTFTALFPLLISVIIFFMIKNN